MSILRLLVAITLLGHGLGHSMGVIASWTKLSMGFSTSPWILPGEIQIKSAVGKIFGALWLFLTGGFVIAAVGLLVNQSWWRAIAMVTSILSIVTILPWWNTFSKGSRQSAILVDVVIIAVLLGPWGELLLSSMG